MKRDKKLLDNLVSKAAYSIAKGNVNSNCMLFFYQPTVPEKVKKLKK